MGIHEDMMARRRAGAVLSLDEEKVDAKAVEEISAKAVKETGEGFMPPPELTFAEGTKSVAEALKRAEAFMRKRTGDHPPKPRADATFAKALVEVARPLAGKASESSSHKFVNAMVSFYDDKGYLTEKQSVVLHRILKSRGIEVGMP